MSFLDRWFKRKQTPPAPTDSHESTGLDVTADGSGTLARLFEAHGVATRCDDIFVDLPHYGARAAARLSWPSPTICQVEVWLKLADGRLISDASAGRGTGPDEAEQDAWQSFVDGTFHVLLSGVLLLPGADHVEVEEWVIHGRRYRAVIGPALCRDVDVDGGIEGGWFPTLRAAIEEAGVEKGLNWLRFFCAQFSGRVAELEVELNNEPWPAVAEKMRALPWPQAENYQSVRLFLVLSEVEGLIRSSIDCPSVASDLASLRGLAKAPVASDYSLMGRFFDR